jgi:hypothetical protein
MTDEQHSPLKAVQAEIEAQDAAERINNLFTGCRAGSHHTWHIERGICVNCNAPFPYSGDSQ